MMFKIFNFILLFLLSGCVKQVEHERVELDNAKTVVYFRNFKALSKFANSYIQVYENGMIQSYKKWDKKLNDKFFESIFINAAKKNIKITKLANLIFLDVYIEQLFYDVKKQEGVLSFTINFAGNFKPFHIKHKFELNQVNSGFNQLFDKAANEIAIFVYLAIETASIKK